MQKKSPESRCINLRWSAVICHPTVSASAVDVRSTLQIAEMDILGQVVNRLHIGFDDPDAFMGGKKIWSWKSFVECVTRYEVK